MNIKWLLKTFTFLFVPLISFSQNTTTTISGNVVSEKGEALQGVTVKSKNNNKSAITNSDGKFQIEVDNKNPALIISYTGYNTKEVSAQSSNLFITLDPAYNDLSEVIVTAVGIKNTKRSINYSVQNLKQDEVTSTKETNVVSALSGKVAGVQINNSSGQPGGSATIRIRGSASALG